MRFDARNFLILFLLIFLSSCKMVRNIGNSNLSAAHTSDAENMLLVRIQPNDTLEICAPTKDIETYTQRAVKKWATVIKRDQYIRIVPCESDAKFRLNVVFNGDGRSYVESAETGSDAVVTANGQTSSNIFLGGNELALREVILLHEVGHLWGVADQYTAENVDRKYTTPTLVATSVMGVSYADKTELTDDDKIAINNIAARDFAYNTAWVKLVGSFSMKGFIQNIYTIAGEIKAPVMNDIKITTANFTDVNSSQGMVVTGFYLPKYVTHVAMCFISDEKVCQSWLSNIKDVKERLKKDENGEATSLMSGTIPFSVEKEKNSGQFVSLSLCNDYGGHDAGYDSGYLAVYDANNKMIHFAKTEVNNSKCEY